MGAPPTEVAMGPVEQAIRRTFKAVPVRLHTLGQQKPFTLSAIDHDGFMVSASWAASGSGCRDRVRTRSHAVARAEV